MFEKVKGQSNASMKYVSCLCYAENVRLVDKYERKLLDLIIIFVQRSFCSFCL